jgi:urease accessory protein
VTITNSAYTASASLPLMIWLSPAFPVGSFAYSHALEWAAQAGDLPHSDALQSWVDDLLAHGAPRNDAIFLSAAWRAAHKGDAAALCDANDLALALTGSRERHLETTAQGDAFMIAIRSSWNCQRLDELAVAIQIHHAHPMDKTVSPPPNVIPGLVPGTHLAATANITARGTMGPGNKCRDDNGGGMATEAPIKRPHDMAYPVAIGLAAAAHNLDLGATLDAYLTAFVSNLTSAAIRLGVTGQTPAQRIVMEALPRIRELAAFAAHATLDDVGGCAFRSDIASMRHETQESRLFRT